MKAIVCGPRDMGFEHQKLVLDTIRNSGASHVIQGGARGADFMAKLATLTLKLVHEEFPADWETHGKRAGPIRNQKMLDQNPDLVIAFVPKTGISRGTGDMVKRANKKGTKVLIVVIPDPPKSS